MKAKIDPCIRQSVCYNCNINIREDVEMTKEEAMAKWQEMKATKYPDNKIKICINGGNQYSGTDMSNEMYSQSCFLQAIAMVAYNEMIDNRIERAEKSWGIK